MPAATPTNEREIVAAISAPRASTYLAAASYNPTRALGLYGWNARISAALMLPAHFAEVTTRNAVSEALDLLYGPRWPWELTFERSLPRTGGPGFVPRQELVSVRRKHSTTGKVIADLKFVFWQTMFTARHQTRIWDPHIKRLFPNAPASMTPAQLRQRIGGDLEVIRILRNRVAHHEPIYSRNLADDIDRILALIELRSAETSTWVRAMEDASPLLADRP